MCLQIHENIHSLIFYERINFINRKIHSKWQEVSEESFLIWTKKEILRGNSIYNYSLKKGRVGRKMVKQHPVYKSNFNGILEYLILIPIIFILIILFVLGFSSIWMEASFITGNPSYDYLLYLFSIILLALIWFTSIRQNEIEIYYDKIIIHKKRRMTFNSPIYNQIIPINSNFSYEIDKNTIYFYYKKEIEKFKVTFPTRRKMEELKRMTNFLEEAVKKNNKRGYFK